MDLEHWQNIIVQGIALEGAIHGLSSAPLGPLAQVVVTVLIVLSQTAVLLTVVTAAFNVTQTRRMDEPTLARFVVEHPILACAPVFALYAAYGAVLLATSIVYWYALVSVLGFGILLLVSLALWKVGPIVHDKVSRSIEGRRVARQQRAGQGEGPARELEQHQSTTGVEQEHV